MSQEFLEIWAEVSLIPSHFRLGFCTLEYIFEPSVMTLHYFLASVARVLPCEHLDQAYLAGIWVGLTMYKQAPVHDSRGM